jgi:hypothetical protein
VINYMQALAETRVSGSLQRVLCARIVTPIRSHKQLPHCLTHGFKPPGHIAVRMLVHVARDYRNPADILVSRVFRICHRHKRYGSDNTEYEAVHVVIFPC